MDLPGGACCWDRPEHRQRQRQRWRRRRRRVRAGRAGKQEEGLHLLAEGQDEPEVSYEGLAELLGQVAVDDLELAGLDVVLVVAEREADQAVLDKEVPDPAVRRVLVPDAEQLCRAGRLAAKEVDGDKEQLAEPVYPSQEAGYCSRAELGWSSPSSPGCSANQAPLVAGQARIRRTS